MKLKSEGGEVTYVEEGGHKFILTDDPHMNRDQYERCIRCQMRLSYWYKIPTESRHRWRCK